MKKILFILAFAFFASCTPKEITPEVKVCRTYIVVEQKFVYWTKIGTDMYRKVSETQWAERSGSALFYSDKCEDVGRYIGSERDFTFTTSATTYHVRYDRYRIRI